MAETTGYADSKVMRAVFKRRSFVMALWPSVILLSGLGMQGMFLAMMAGMPVFVSMLFLFGGIYLGLAILAGEAEYTADETGLTQKIDPLSFARWMPRKINRHFRWNEIEWFSLGSDMNRSLETYQFIKVKLHRWPYHLQISSDKANPVDFDHFAAVFSHYAEKEPTVKPILPEVIPAAPYSEPATKRRPEFYETRTAKVVFWSFALFFVALIFWMNETGIFKWTYAFRFLFIIIPGMGYFYYRIYVKPRKNSQS